MRDFNRYISRFLDREESIPIIMICFFAILVVILFGKIIIEDIHIKKLKTERIELIK